MVGKRHQVTARRRRSSAAFDQRIYSSNAIAAVVAELGKQGIDASEALEDTGLTASQLDTHKTRSSYRQLDTVIRNALRLSKDPAIALHAGQRMHITGYGMVGYALLSSPTFAEARHLAARFNRVHGPLCDMAISHHDKTIIFSLSPRHWPDPSDDVHRFAVEFSLAAHLSSTRDFVDQPFSFSRVCVDYVEPLHSGSYGELFGCPVAFGQRNNEYQYESSWDVGPAIFANASTHSAMREICERLLDNVDHAEGIAPSIRRILIQQPGRFPTIETIAKSWDMHPQTLRRRLKLEGVSYRDLLAEARLRLAIEYLRTTRMTNEEIARQLGYSDASNFRHALVRWTGKNPSDFRGRVRN